MRNLRWRRSWRAPVRRWRGWRPFGASESGCYVDSRAAGLLRVVLGRVDQRRHPRHDRDLPIADPHRDPALGVVADHLERHTLLEAHRDQPPGDVVLVPADPDDPAALALLHEVEGELDGHARSRMIIIPVQHTAGGAGSQSGGFAI